MSGAGTNEAKAPRGAASGNQPSSRQPAGGFDVDAIRRDFPILRRTIRGKPLVYLDNAATTQKPGAVIDRVSRYYSEENANIHRGVHFLSEAATTAYEAVRGKAAELIGAASDREIVFVRGTTEAVNLVAQTLGRSTVSSGDEVLITHLEHHSNIVPWQILCQQTGATLKVAPINDQGEVILEEYEALLGAKTRIVAISHISNALGTITPVKTMTKMAHHHGATVLIDGAQATAHTEIDVVDLDCDFYTVSAHKMYGPTGIGILYGKKALLEKMPPYQGGGDMILSVTFDKTSYNRVPHKFEAGTPNIAGTVGFGEAIDYLRRVGLPAIASHENDLLAYATEQIAAIPSVHLIGTAREKASILSFVIEGVHPHDIGTILDQEGVAIRAGHHCAQPVMERFGIPATVRASFGIYNTREDVDVLTRAVHKVQEIFG